MVIKMKILIVDDEEATRLYLNEVLTREGYDTDSVGDGTECLEKLRETKYELIILDIMLPGIDGLYICAQVRLKPEIYGNPGIIMLTAKDRTEDLILGFDKGADDYLKKPFDERELLSRISALLRRKGAVSKNYKYRDILIDTEKTVVFENGEEILLTKKEYDVLLYFVVNKGITLMREKATEDIWDTPYYQGLRTLDTYVKVLKKKFESLKESLINIRGFGYRLEND